MIFPSYSESTFPTSYEVSQINLMKCLNDLIYLLLTFFISYIMKNGDHIIPITKSYAYLIYKSHKMWVKKKKKKKLVP